MQEKKRTQKAHAFLALTDFHVLLSALEAYLRLALLPDRKREPYQNLYAKVDMAVATMGAGNLETIDLTHEELLLLLTALLQINETLATQKPEGRDVIKRYPLLLENVARVQGCLWAELLRASGGKPVQLLN